MSKSEQLSENEMNKLLEIFFPNFHNEKNRLSQQDLHLIHYTNAETAQKILLTKTFWMRDSRCLNDYMELHHGLLMLRKALTGKRGQENFASSLNSVHSDAFEEIDFRFNEIIDGLNSGVYLGCFSEHSLTEDAFGRLSMWRAYGGPLASVGIVFSRTAFFNEENPLETTVSPVAYFADNEVEEEIVKIGKNISDSREFLKTIDRRILIGSILEMLKYAIICTKHKGFREEREWRLINSPYFGTSSFVNYDVECIKGIPQRVCKIPIVSNPEIGLSGATLSQLVKQIIIGPSQYPDTIANAFVEILRSEGIENPEERVVMSSIPLRL